MTVAFLSSAHDPVADRNGRKEELKEIEIQKEGGYREEDLVNAHLLNETGDAETKDAEQDGLQQRNNGSARKHQELSLLRFRFFFGNEIPARRDRAEDDLPRADDRRSGSRDDLPFPAPAGDPISQGVARFMEQYGEETKKPDKKDLNKVKHRTNPLRRRDSWSE